MRISDWSSDVCSSDLKLVALWLSAWNLGVAHNRHEHALIAFVERQTGIAHVNWVRDQRDGAAAVEALKKWIAREAHVEWPVGAEADGRANKIAVIAAQHRKLSLGGKIGREAWRGRVGPKG